MAEQTISEQLTAIEVKLETKAKTDAEAAANAVTAELKTKLTTAETELTELKNWKVTKEESDKKNQAWIDSEVAGGKRGKVDKAESKSFNQILCETIERNADAISNARPLNTTGLKAQEVAFDMLPNEKKSAKVEENEVKAVGDMSITANFPGATSLYQDVRGPMIESTYNRIWIADLLPNGTSTGTQVVYPKETGSPAGTEGGVAAWTDYTADKPQVDWDFTSQTVGFTWLAGWAIVQRDMLDDIPWMTSYLQSRLLISLKTAENDFILNGSGAIPGLQDVASPYNGSMVVPVDRIVDAALGQIPDATSEFYQGTHVIARIRDLITKIGLNKSGGSEEYDLPSGAVAFNNGRVTIGTLQVVGTTAIPFDTFYALDARATMFIRRIQPELRMFEDATLAKKNQVLFRIEERAALIVFNNAAIVKGVLELSA